jgi:hypothetical protein
MTDLGEKEPSEERSDKPPKSNWEATQKDRFLDLKLSHYIEILLTLALVGIACLQYVVYRRQAGIMQTQADIADRQNSITEATQRAFVGISRVDVVKPKNLYDSHAQWKITPVIENSGATPAIDVSLGFIDPDIEVLATPTGMDFTEYQKMSEIIGAPRDPDELIDQPLPLGNGPTFWARLLSHGTIGPKSPLITSGLGIEINYSRLGDPDARTGRFLYGSIRYFDTFDPVKRHITKFCFSMTSLEASPRTDEGPEPPFLCTHWNCTDDYCKADKEDYEKAWEQAIALRKADKALLPPIRSK